MLKKPDLVVLGGQIDVARLACVDCSAPADLTTRTKWLNNLVKAEFQGCGHIRLMLQDNTTAFYSVQLAGDAVSSCAAVAAAANATVVTETGAKPDDCISAKEIAEEVIRLYFE